VRSAAITLAAAGLLATGCSGSDDKQQAKERRAKERAKMEQALQAGPIEKVYTMSGGATLRVVRIPINGKTYLDYRVCYVWESPAGAGMDCPSEDSVMDFGDIDWRDESDKPRAKP
jgi:hypothetical protein